MQPYLFTFAQLKQLPKLFDLFVKHNVFVFDCKWFSEMTIVREHNMFKLFDLLKSRL